MDIYPILFVLLFDVVGFVLGMFYWGVGTFKTLFGDY